ncbi:hypothetical protein AAVH_22471 [Aphelenchoides avenae]|nr:hypothetical protein AAVH_22471 [Aphelenchus avenae]
MKKIPRATGLRAEPNVDGTSTTAATTAPAKDTFLRFRKSRLPTDHFDRRLRLLTDLERRWARYHRTRGADRARYRNLGSAVVKENFEGVFEIFDVSRLSFTSSSAR